MKKYSIIYLLLILLVQETKAQEFNVSYSPSVLKEKFSGHVLLYLSKESKHPKDAMAGFDAFPCFSIEVNNIAPGQAVSFNDAAVSFPATLSNIERGDYYVQAVWDRNLGGRAISASEGNLYSTVQRVSITKDYKKKIVLVADQKIGPAVFKATGFDKELKVPSNLLTDFLHRKTTVDAAVILPEEYYKDSTKKFPVLFIVSGYGGDYHRFSGDSLPTDPLDSIPVIWVFLDGNCPLGHSVYANSENNGPWGDALTKEFIPALEKQYRCNGARLLQGHSSGGWTVLWLQTHYPEVFAGCSSSSPDPVDFRNFQRINLYEDKNLYYGKDSALNLVATVAGAFPWATMKNICQAENVVSRGEQMHSFNAVFSARDQKGNPREICNAVTGEIDPVTFSHWKNYDISLYLRTNWEQIKGTLDGKVRISVGNQDNFLLNYSVKLLESEMKKLHSSFEFEYYPGDHFTVSTKEYRKAQAAFLKKRYLAWQKEKGQ